MQAISLQSGSNGNCIYVETSGVRLLFDAGICGSQAEGRLRARGRDIRDVDALIISHDHADHVKYAGVFQRKYGVPVYITPRTLAKAESSHRLGKLHDVHCFFSGGSIQIGGVTIESVPTPHDGEDGSVFILDSGTKRLGILTDIGHVFQKLIRVVPTLDGVFMESNYDPGMLEAGRYPAFLKKRICGDGGHLSNIEAAELLSYGERLKWACLAHLSQDNNDPSLALKTHRKVLGNDLPLHVAGRHLPTDILRL
ncbi:MAG: MBL fold metallo-hydrolase [Nitrospirae bacterium]|nr:MAG: MBL fold metallo-hydrolase [Nitrospirota bacterium]